jgi:hypothetical protein
VFVLLVVSRWTDHVGLNFVDCGRSLATDHKLSRQDTVDKDTVFALLVVSKQVDHVGLNFVDCGRPPSHHSLPTISCPDNLPSTKTPCSCCSRYRGRSITSASTSLTAAGHSLPTISCPDKILSSLRAITRCRPHVNLLSAKTPCSCCSLHPGGPTIATRLSTAGLRDVTRCRAKLVQTRQRSTRPRPPCRPRRPRSRRPHLTHPVDDRRRGLAYSTTVLPTTNQGLHRCCIGNRMTRLLDKCTNTEALT